MLIQSGAATRLGDEDHFDWISAFHKSLRGSDPHAALYWLARMLRRAKTRNSLSAVSWSSLPKTSASPNPGRCSSDRRERRGGVRRDAGVLPGAEPPLSTCRWRRRATRPTFRISGPGTDPCTRCAAGSLRIRNAPTRLMKELGFGQGYQYPHDEPRPLGAPVLFARQIKGETIFRPSEMGREPRMIEDHRRRTRDFYRLRSDELLRAIRLTDRRRIANLSASVARGPSPSSSRPRTPPFQGGNTGSNPVGDAITPTVSSVAWFLLRRVPRSLKSPSCSAAARPFGREPSTTQTTSANAEPKERTPEAREGRGGCGSDLARVGAEVKSKTNRFKPDIGLSDYFCGDDPDDPLWWGVSRGASSQVAAARSGTAIP